MSKKQPQPQQTPKVTGYNLLTRKEIAEMWISQDEELLNKFCCPHCRDLLDEAEEEGIYFCHNSLCSLFSVLVCKV